MRGYAAELRRKRLSPARRREIAEQLLGDAPWLEELWAVPLLLASPCGDQWPVSFPFGWSPDYPFNAGWHLGKDYATPAGSPSWCREAGTVVWAGLGPVGFSDSHGLVYEGAWGLYVEVQADRDADVRWGLAHHSSIEVAVGDHVEAGQVVGLTGETGLTYGPHLHEMRFVGGDRVDPDG